MALATQADVEADLGRELSPDETNRVASLLAKASAVVIGYAGQDFEPAPHPEGVVAVTAGVVARLLQAAGASGPSFAEQESAGPFSIRYSSNAASGDVWLTASDKLALRPHRRGGGLSSVRVVGDRYEITGA